ncbi:hypothetical protein [Marinicella sp. W31]|uniref:hypothetical protein n=1 Tax=Marinicella sp. W31 TaxID=3023713 RepID=UPI00375682BE
MHYPLLVGGLIMASLSVHAVETTVQNDSLENFSSGAVQSGFIANEQGAVWLDSPCDGNIVGVQVFWRSASGTAADTIEQQITISEAGTFPEPGTELEAIVGPVMNDGVFNEFRFLDEESVIPLIVPVSVGETYVVAFQFENSPNQFSASLVSDADGCQAGRNSIHAFLGEPINDFVWFSSCDLGVSGDFAIRAVIDCPSDPTSVDLAISNSGGLLGYLPGEDLTFEVIASNNGPIAVNSAAVIDTFSTQQFSSVDWTCSGTGGATCPNLVGTGNITESVTLPALSSLTYDVVATVAADMMGNIDNTAQILTPVGLVDTDPMNNSAELIITPDLIFRDGFD